MAGLETSGWQIVVWDSSSATDTFHGTQTINFWLYIRRFDTTDLQEPLASQLLWVKVGTITTTTICTHPPGFYWWEIDPTYYGLKIMSWLGLVSDLKPVPERILEEGRIRDLENEPKLAIIGTGISGMACGHFLQKEYDVHLYEQNKHIGGHSLTAEAEESGSRSQSIWALWSLTKRLIPI